MFPFGNSSVRQIYILIFMLKNKQKKIPRVTGGFFLYKMKKTIFPLHPCSALLPLQVLPSYASSFLAEVFFCFDIFSSFSLASCSMPDFNSASAEISPRVVFSELSFSFLTARFVV